MTTFRRLLVVARAAPELAAVAVAAVIGLTVQAPLAWLDRHDAIDAALVILVAACAVTISPADVAGARRQWRPLAGVLVAGATVLPAYAWALAHLVAGGPLRSGMRTVGLAPCEIASVATTSMAGGDAALAAGALIGSTAVCVALAGPVLGLESGGAHLATGSIVVSLLLVVAVPLAVGLVLRARLPRLGAAESGANRTAAATVACLVALVAAQVHLSAHYAALVGALLLFLAGTAALGWAIGRKADRRAGAAILLTTSMRDFAIAAGLASAAYGPAAAAPLGIYGILVLIWGTWVASRRRSARMDVTREPADRPPPAPH